VTPVRSKTGPPADLAPQLATAADTAPAGDGWLHEIKYDGYRLLCRIEGGRARLISRNGKDWSERFPSVVRAAESLPARDAVLDGEVAVVRPDGRTSFQDLQNALSGETRGGSLRFFLFDLLFLDGANWMDVPLERRKERLAALLDGSSPETLQYSDHVVGNGPAFHRQACGYRLEGILSKRRDAPYRPGRSRDWLKVKCVRQDEFVVGGWTEPGGSRQGLGALLVGGHDADGVLRFAGRVGTGFSDSQLISLRKRLDALARATPPFAGAPSGRAAADMHWVEPEIVIQAGYVDWTFDRLLRHPRFIGFRSDVEPRDVRLPASDIDRESDVDRGTLDDRASVSDESQPSAGSSVTAGEAARPVPGGRTGRSHTSRMARTRRSDRSTDGPTVVEGITVTNPDKVLYPETGIRKIELVRYFEAVAERMLPLVSDRPLTLVRCPDGIGNCFYQKHLEGTVPAAIGKIPIQEGDEVAQYACVTSAAGLVALAQLGVVEIHAGGSRRESLERPDRFTIDLDPDPDVPWVRVVEAVLDVRGFLGELGFDSFLKTTGGKGLHVVVAIRPDRGWDEVKEFTRSIARAIAAEQPGRYTLNISKEKRKGRILLDYLRNGRGATAIEAWSTRARPGAPVALPVRWEELAEGLQSDRYTLRNLPDRLAALREDPWLGYEESRRRVTRAMLRKVGMQ